jgi:hypothetical protein
MRQTICILSSALLLASCYSDKGNYDYHFDDLNEIKTVQFTPGIEETIDGKVIEFTQPLTVNDTIQRITVQTDQSKFDNAGNLDFYWFRTYKNKQGNTVKDTVTTAGYMDVVLPMGISTTYNVML